MNEINNTLATKIATRNSVNALANDLLPEIEMVRKEVFVARNALHVAERKLAGFGEHDNG